MKRILIPIAAGILGILVALSFTVDPAKSPTSATSTPTPQETAKEQGAPDAPPPPTSSSPENAAETPDTPDTPTTTSDAATPPPSVPAGVKLATFEGLHTQTSSQPANVVSIGSDDPASPYMMRVDLTPWGAGYQKITLSRYKQRVTDEAQYIIAETVKGGNLARYPFAAQRVAINGSSPIDLERAAWSVSDSGEGFAEYRMTLVDADDQVVLEIVRRYELDENSYSLNCNQDFINHTDQPIQVIFRQSLQGDIKLTKGGYLGDQRKIVTGYFRPAFDPAQSSIYADNAFRLRAAVIKSGELWPNEDVGDDKRLAWLVSENRYFALTTHARVAKEVKTTAELGYFDEPFARFGIESFPSSVAAADRGSLFTATTPIMTLMPKQPQRVDISLFAGPRESELYAEPPYSILDFGLLIRYEMGCAWLTFQSLAHFLLWFLTILDHYVTFDWGISIVVLVLIVRLILHPITKKAQINMQKMGKQMQLLQPEMAKIKKKYKDDQTKMNQEVMKLYREKGVNPANILGCLPMLLQMPIWIALYAMLYFAIELRQESAFYGVFQWVSGGGWHFLQDLSQPDNFIRFVPFGEEGIKLNLYFIQPHFSGINILPLLMAVVFYFQQKLTTPPPANEQAAQQQKIMKFMILLFPIMLYSAPSGLTLYILASTAAGIVDSYIVRKHINEQEAAGTLFDKKPRKPGGFADRMAKRLEEKQNELQKRQQANRKYKKKGKG